LPAPRKVAARKSLPALELLFYRHKHASNGGLRGATTWSFVSDVIIIAVPLEERP